MSTVLFCCLFIVVMVRLVRSIGVDSQSTCRLPVDIEVVFLFLWSGVLLVDWMRCGSLWPSAIAHTIVWRSIGLVELQVLRWFVVAYWKHWASAHALGGHQLTVDVQSLSIVVGLFLVDGVRQW